MEREVGEIFDYKGKRLQVKKTIGTCCVGKRSMVKARKGSWITLAEWKDNVPICVKTEFVDGERIKENVWYKLVNGEFVEQ